MLPTLQIFVCLYRGLFSELNKLEYLDLRYNKLVHFKPNTFNGLTNLQTLNMSDNQLTFEDLEETAGLDDFGPRSPLNNCKNLQDLQLANNSIKEVFSDWRLVMGSLRKLNLAHNKITRLEVSPATVIQYGKFINKPTL